MSYMKSRGLICIKDTDFIPVKGTVFISIKDTILDFVNATRLAHILSQKHQTFLRLRLYLIICHYFLMLNTQIYTYYPIIKRYYQNL